MTTAIHLIETALAYSVMNFGAVGDGVTDDSAAFQAAVTAGVKELVCPAGTTGRTFLLASRVNLTGSDMVIRGTGLAKIKWKAGVTNTGSMLYATGNNIKIRDIRLQGDEYSAFGDTINPANLVRYGDASAEITGVEVENVKFRGGKVGLAIWWATDVSLKGVRFNKHYEYGAFTSMGCRNLTVEDYRATDIGLYEGFKFGHSDTGQISERVQISNMVLENCGRLDTNTANHQEGLDLYVADIRRGHFKDIQIIGCGNGGVELKTKKSAYSGYTDEFEDLVFENISVRVIDSNQPAFALNWATASAGSAESPAPASTKCRRIKFINCSAVYDPSGDGQMFIISAYQDIEIINATCYGADTFIRTDGTGGSDATVRRISVFGGKVRCTGNAIYHAHGALDVLDLCGVDIEADECGVIFALGTNSGRVTNVRIRGGSRIVALGTSTDHNAVSGQCLDSILIEGSYLEAEHIVIQAPVSTALSASVGGTVRRNTLKARDNASNCYALQAQEGTWNFYNNDLDLPDSNAAGWDTTGAGTVNAGRNSRGVTTDDTPNTGGAPGDYWLFANPDGGEMVEINCASGAVSSATWTPTVRIPLSGSATYDPASLADGDGATTTVTVTGAALGDFAQATFSLDLQGIQLTSWVSAADTVSARFQNETGGTIDLASGTLRARVHKA